MQDWNVVVNLRERGFKQAFKVLQGFGSVSQTDFFNVVALKVTDIPGFLPTLRESIERDPDRFAFLARLVPVTSTFSFQSPEEFESKAKENVLQWLPQLAGKHFHVRMYRRGFKGKLSSLDEERALAAILLEEMERTGTPGEISFQDPDAIVVVETLGQWCGMSCWTREDLQQYPFLKID